MPKHCPDCRQEYRDEARQCADCGADLVDGPPPALKVQEPVRDAHEILKEADQEGEAGEAMEEAGLKCSRCGSADIGEKPHRRLTWLLILLSLITVGLILLPLVVYWYLIKILPKVIVCKQCRHTWVRGEDMDSPLIKSRQQ